MTSRWSAAALLAAVFFAGIAATLATLRVVEHRRAPAWESGPPQLWRGEPPPGRMGRTGSRMGVQPFVDRAGAELARARVTERMALRLGLTDDQRDRIEAAMERSRITAQERMNEVVPWLRSRMDSLNAEIEEILDPGQRERFRAFLLEDMERFRQRRGRPEARRPGMTP